MDAEQTPRPPFPLEPLECRQRAEQLLANNDGGDDPAAAIAWALLALAGEMTVIRRGLAKQARRT